MYTYKRPEIAAACTLSRNIVRRSVFLSKHSLGCYVSRGKPNGAVRSTTEEQDTDNADVNDEDEHEEEDALPPGLPEEDKTSGTRSNTEKKRGRRRKDGWSEVPIDENTISVGVDLDPVKNPASIIDSTVYDIKRTEVLRPSATISITSAFSSSATLMHYTKPTTEVERTA